MLPAVDLTGTVAEIGSRYPSQMKEFNVPNELVKLLKQSVKLNGPNLPITTGHLLNLAKILRQREEKLTAQDEANHNEIINEIEF